MNVNGTPIATDDEGYLVEPNTWDETVAQELSRREGVALGDDHWRVIRFMREYHEQHGIAADARFAIRFLSDALGYGREAKRRLFELFPYGYVRQACKIAGMRRPRAWSTG